MFGSTAPAFGSNTSQTSSSPFGTGSSQPANNASSGFGGFGTMSQNNTNAGAVGTGSGSGLFGMSSNNNGGGTLGNGTAGPNSGPFGQATPAAGNNAPSLFGASSLSSNSGLNLQQGSGTAIKPFSAYTEKDATTGVNNVFQSISCMPEYRNYSFEELRFQDYQANRRFASNAPTAATGVSSPFGANPSNSPFNNTNSMSSFGSVGNNTNTNTNAGGGLFGQNAAAPGTGATSSFGQPSNSMFGNTAQNNTSNSPFGMNKPASSGGLFGQTSATGANTSGGMFGQTANTPNQNSGGLFGQNNNTGNIGTGGLFGASNQNQQSGGLFGNNSNTGGSLFGQNNQNKNAPFGSTNTTATGNGLFGQTNATTANSPFGQQTQQSSGGLFGSKPANSGGMFGANSSTPAAGTGGLFGQSNASNSPFGQTNNTPGGAAFGQNQAQNQGSFGGSGLFGQSNTNTTSGGLFGQNNNANANTGSGLFGQNNANNSGGLFGQQNAATNPPFGQSSSGFSSFGQQQPQNQQNSSLFGAKPAGTTGGGLFGSGNNTASSGFGQNTNTGGGLFGQNTNTNTSGNTGGLFGQNNTSNIGGGQFGQNSNQQQQPQQQSGGGLFGQNNNQQNQGGLFGQSNNTGGGLFGQNNNQQPSGGGLFGAKPASTSLGGQFGQASGQQQQQQQGGGLFGQANNQSNTGGLFGNKPAAPTGGLFNQNSSTGATGGGLFGQSNAGASNTSSLGSGGLFGNKPATGSNTGGGLFGSKPAGQSSGGLFGAKPAENASSGGLFGSKPAGNGLSFNSGNNASVSGGLFGNQQNQQQGMQPPPPAAQQTSMNPYGTNELFSRVIVPDSITKPIKPSATKLNADLKKKASLSGAYRLAPKPLFIQKSAISAPVMRLGSSASDKSLHGVGNIAGSSTESLGRELQHQNNSPSFTNESDELILASNDTLFNPDKKSFKNLIINRKKMEDSAKKDDDQVLRITFASEKNESQDKNGALFASAPENDRKATPLLAGDSGKLAFTDNHTTKTPIGKSTAPQAENLAPATGDVTKADGFQRKLGVLGDDVSFEDDGYYISPSLESLPSMTLLQLRKVNGLTIGHKDYGKVEFLEPVDLTNTSLPALCGQIVVFEPRSCSVYPNGSEIPPRGQGLNVRARISQYGCYPQDKATREPIKNPNHPIIKRHINRLKAIPGTKFESYNPQLGTWVFTTDSPAGN
ncbi:FG-nucleoporin NUP116 LALA0_S06e03554g [Lachancea lanzarotensis]|uniref:LALA0S06e03554g1_1 n=1 Tax=Lachancea lanzarotensis TaxID=1245769 RepID=A0A0C7N484_9SACH|nr:uncharacterized protein LALA0_S06e03554g [Lachancea lanzarotensis]CEP62776.1 LALA0S06e03554g1_1 [Lachancea lanzarotensis]